MATAATAAIEAPIPASEQIPIKVGTLPVILPELTYPNANPEELEAVKALLAEPERDNNAQKAKAVSRISLAPLTPNNVGTVRKLNAVLFPIRYSESFYHNIVQPEAEPYCQLAYYRDIPVGVICCRIEKVDGSSDAKIYCMTMGVLAPYRHRRVASTALTHVLDWAHTTNSANTKPSASKPRFTTMYLHVQVNNDGARKFYEHHGFKMTGIEDKYYKKIEPREAWILELDLTTYQPPPATA